MVRYLFNGDMVDRGSQAWQIMTICCNLESWALAWGSGNLAHPFLIFPGGQWDLPQAWPLQHSLAILGSPKKLRFQQHVTSRLKSLFSLPVWLATFAKLPAPSFGITLPSCRVDFPFTLRCHSIGVRLLQKSLTDENLPLEAQISVWLRFLVTVNLFMKTTCQHNWGSR